MTIELALLIRTFSIAKDRKPNLSKEGKIFAHQTENSGAHLALGMGGSVVKSHPQETLFLALPPSLPLHTLFIQ